MKTKKMIKLLEHKLVDGVSISRKRTRSISKSSPLDVCWPQNGRKQKTMWQPTCWPSNGKVPSDAQSVLRH